MVMLKLWKRVVILSALGWLAGCGQAGGEPQKPYPSIDDLPACDPEKPSGDCLKRLFLPLRDTDWPFDRERVAAAYSSNESQVLPGWDLTALHVLDGRVSSTGSVPNCYAGELTFAEPGTTLSRPNCGDLLFLGGHPHSLQCEAEGVSLLSCVDQVPVAETFDIGLVAADITPTQLEVRDDVAVGEEVFAVGSPGFLLLGADQAAVDYLNSHYPLVSSGKVLALDGRGMIVSNLAFSGNSGGPILDRNGKVVGVVSTKVADMRAEGTATDPALPGHRTVAVRIDSEMKAFIDSHSP